jgi:preprotein translocase SecE subunit
MKKIFGAIARYFKGVKKEIGRIRWTTGKDLLKASTTTVAFMLFLGVYFYVIDLVISLLRSVAA